MAAAAAIATRLIPVAAQVLPQVIPQLTQTISSIGESIAQRIRYKNGGDDDFPYYAIRDNMVCGGAPESQELFSKKMCYLVIIIGMLIVIISLRGCPRLLGIFVFVTMLFITHYII